MSPLDPCDPLGPTFAKNAAEDIVDSMPAPTEPSQAEGGEVAICCLERWEPGMLIHVEPDCAACEAEIEGLRERTQEGEMGGRLEGWVDPERVEQWKDMKAEARSEHLPFDTFMRATTQVRATLILHKPGDDDE